MRATFIFILVTVVTFYSREIIDDSKVRQQILSEYSEVNNVKYGLLSIHSWKRQISSILAKKIDEFEINDNNREELRLSIQKVIYQVLNEVDLILLDKKNKSNWFSKAFISFFQTMVLDLNEIRIKVPEFSDLILNELNNDSSKEKLRQFIHDKVDELLYLTVKTEDFSKIEFISNKYGCNNISECSNLLQTKLKKLNKNLTQNSLIIIVITILVFTLIFFSPKNIVIIEYLCIILLCIHLLYLGINTPMIDIDVRIQNFRFILMGETLEFSEQILFFESKSIIDVVKLLISTREYQSVIVAVLIFLFSIFFPISKLIASIGLIINIKLFKYNFVKFLAMKSGKWSMSDVFVVAIFMSYFGFKGIINNQLSRLEGIKDRLEILTMDNSNFFIGFTLFLSFCIGGMLLAVVIEMNTKNILN